MKAYNIGIALIAIAGGASCGGSNDVPPASQVDAGNTMDTGTGTDPLPNIELDCAPEAPEPGRFAADCQIVGSADVIVQCSHITEPGSGGMIQINVHKPERIVVGVPTPIGSNDPVVSLGVASYSVREGTLVQTLNGTQEGAIVFSLFERGRSLRGRFTGVTIQATMGVTFACHIADADFAASAPVR